MVEALIPEGPIGGAARSQTDAADPLWPRLSRQLPTKALDGRTGDSEATDIGVSHDGAGGDGQDDARPVLAHVARSGGRRGGKRWHSVPYRRRAKTPPPLGKWARPGRARVH